ncbi:recombinase family protein [Streptomyces sp. WI03-4A]|uniref:recombinase family protein n=1 Tax=Streptomyces sp. WI03-4A TaxID=3028706 RepID=UPI0029C03565|nr:recombinase family protein [Streptomyces sp. WI03-4A]
MAISSKSMTERGTVLTGTQTGEGPLHREDYATLKALGFEDDELKALGLWEPATAPPERLVEAYLRRSKKREDLATMRQHLREIVRHRWPDDMGEMQIRHVWFEQLSASKTYVRRPQFEHATEAVFGGLSKTLAFWKTDRFDRRGMGAVGRMLDEFDRRRAGLVSTTEGLDSRRPGARIVFAILSERAREEAKDITLRVNTGLAAHRLEGRRGTGLPPFGLISPRLEDGKASGTVAHHPKEYKAARRLADLLLGKWVDDSGKPGERLTGTAAAKRMNAEGFRLRTGAEFSGSAVSRIVQSPLWGGMIPRTERVMDEYGNPTGKWVQTKEPLLDDKGNAILCGNGVVTPGEWYAIKASFAERTGDSGKGKRGAEYLLTGILRCGRCNGWMRHHKGYYRCVNWATKGTCEGISTRAPRLEFAVAETWIRHVTALEPDDDVLHDIARRWLAYSDPETQAEREHARSALEAAQGRVKKLEDDYYVKGRMDEERFEELSAQQHATITTMTAKLESLSVEGNLGALMDADLLRESFNDENTPLSDRRMLLQSALISVTVAPSLIGRGDRTPIEDRLTFRWV